MDLIEIDRHLLERAERLLGEARRVQNEHPNVYQGFHPNEFRQVHDGVRKLLKRSKASGR